MGFKAKQADSPPALPYNPHMKGSSKSRPPNTASLRKLLIEVLPADSDLDGFCMDRFRSTFDKFAGGLDRTQKLNLLLQREDAQAIVQALQEHESPRFQRYQHLLGPRADAEEKKKRVGSTRVSKQPGISSAPAQASRPAQRAVPAPSGDVTITILHVSDMQFGRNHRFGRLGLGGPDEPFDTLLKRLTDDLDKLHRDQGLKPDLVALTGDLAEWGLKQEYDDVYGFCVGLQEHLSLGRDRILVIPGNHDINRKLCESYFAKCEGRAKKPVEPYWPKWEPYVEFFRKLYKGVERYKFEKAAPYTWFELPELKLVVAGMNSTLRESHKDRAHNDPDSLFGHYGYVGEAQLDWFNRRLEEAEKKGWLRIGLVHHNALRGATDDDENLRDAQLLKERIGSKLNLLLHGHTHNDSLEWLAHKLPVISTGSAAVKGEQRPEEVPNQYQIIQVRRDRFTTWAQQYAPGRRAWIADPRISKDGRQGFHEQQLDLADTHGTFGTREAEAHPVEHTALHAALEASAQASSGDSALPLEVRPNPSARAQNPSSNPTLNKLRDELRKVLQDAPGLTTALVRAGFGEGALAGKQQIESVCEALLVGRIADVTLTIARLARESEHGASAAQLLCLVLPLASDIESVLAATSDSGNGAGTLVLPLRTTTFAEVAMARLDGRRAEFIPGGLYVQGLRRILMPSVGHIALIDPDGRELADALIRNLRTEHQVDGMLHPDATNWRTIQGEHPGGEAFRKGVSDQVRLDALFGRSRYLLFIDDELDGGGHLKGDAALDALWQTVREKLPRALPGLRVVRLTVRMAGHGPSAVADETLIARIIGDALPSE